MTDRASSMHSSLENSLVLDIPVQTPASFDFMECWVQMNDYYVFALTTLSVNITLTSIGPQGIRESE